MKIPRDVSGERVAQMLCGRWQYVRVHQTGSHIILETTEPSHQRIAIPNHDALRVGRSIQFCGRWQVTRVLRVG
jgi:predicted RNA binding protein YcfA (HicA-like mRNA interferase family)